MKKSKHRNKDVQPLTKNGDELKHNPAQPEEVWGHEQYASGIVYPHNFHVWYLFVNICTFFDLHRFDYSEWIHTL